MLFNAEDLKIAKMELLLFIIIMTCHRIKRRDTMVRERLRDCKEEKEVPNLSKMNENVGR